MGLIYYRHYIGDYDKDTKNLSLLEHGVYAKLMHAYYANMGPIDADADSLFRVTVAIKQLEQAAVLKVASRFFRVRDGKLHSSRCDEEISAILAMSDKQRKKADARWEKARDAVGHAAAPAAAHAAAYAPAMPVKIHKPKKERAAPLPPGEYGAEFNAFWAVYPGANKGSKKDAAGVWSRKKLNDRCEELMLDVKSRASRHGMWVKEDGKYIPMVTTYLRGQHWETDIDERGAKPSSGKRDTEKENLSTADAWAKNHGDHDVE